MNRPVGRFSSLWGGAVLPQDFVVVDIETSGLSTHHDVIVEIGRCRVEGGRVVDAGSTFIDWTNEPTALGVEARLSKLAQEMPAAVTWDELKGGPSPLKAAQVVAGMFQSFAKTETPLVGHNLIRFDLPWLHAYLRRYTGYDLMKYRGPLVDTAAIVVSDALAADPRVHPTPRETLSEWSYRVLTKLGGKTKYKLHDTCVPRYGLSTDGLPGKAHRAAFDSALTARLMLALGKIELAEPVHDLADLDARLSPTRTPATERPAPLVHAPQKRWRGQRP